MPDGQFRVPNETPELVIHHGATPFFLSADWRLALASRHDPRCSPAFPTLLTISIPACTCFPCFPHPSLLSGATICGMYTCTQAHDRDLLLVMNSATGVIGPTGGEREQSKEDKCQIMELSIWPPV